MPIFYIMSGIPGSGKTTLAKNIPTDMWSPNEDGLLLNIINSDDARKLLLEEKGFSDVNHQNFLSDDVMSEHDKSHGSDPQLVEKITVSLDPLKVMVSN